MGFEERKMAIGWTMVLMFVFLNWAFAPILGFFAGLLFTVVNFLGLSGLLEPVLMPIQRFHSAVYFFDWQDWIKWSVITTAVLVIISAFGQHVRVAKAAKAQRDNQQQG